MGEIIVSVVIGGCLVLSGIALILMLNREERRWKAEGGTPPQAGTSNE